MPDPYAARMIRTYVGFVVLVLALLALDLGVLHRKAHVVSVKALGWSAFWIALGLSFAGFLYTGYENHWLGPGPGRFPDMMTLSPQAVEGLAGVFLLILAAGVGASLVAARRDRPSPALPA